MSLSNIRNLAYNILKKLGDDAVKDKEFTELAKCPECDKDVLSPDFEAFTVLSCGHIFHRECIEKTFLLTRQSYCPVADCTTFLKPVLTERSFSASSQSSSPSIASRMSSQLQLNSPIIQEEERVNEEEVEVQPDENSNKKRTNEATNSSSSKKSKKHVRPEDSNNLKRLIRELSSDSTRISEIKEKEGLHRASEHRNNSARTLFDLYYKITEAEEQNEKVYHDLIRSYYLFGEELEKRLAEFMKSNEEHEALKKLYNEVKDQLPKEVTRNALRKKADRARKVYDLFFGIGDDKSARETYIRRVKTFPVTSIAKLSEDEVRYVVTKVREGRQA
ncbi:hypothetical protein RhiirA4_457455 [Rhizophagus irregularis]|uniref:RING-type domain-containing protein n=1 Tax=Rhizophagus irregularis TaxID=588596 RepID=A0A2I1GA21_9GLOM|nr:hypothetical protein RhiirA4_457455 [Rhizophagus irregularis]